jgi:hypothetical protein
VTNRDTLKHTKNCPDSVPACNGLIELDFLSSPVFLKRFEDMPQTPALPQGYDNGTPGVGKMRGGRAGKGNTSWAP